MEGHIDAHMVREWLPSPYTDIQNMTIERVTRRRRVGEDEGRHKGRGIEIQK